MTVYRPQDYSVEYNDAFNDVHSACMGIVRYVAPLMEKGLTLLDIEDTFGSSVLTELRWQQECAQP